MTLEELDSTLKKNFGVDVNTPEGREVRNKILILHGNGVIAAKTQRCSICWMKEKRGICPESCEYHDISDDPLSSSETYLSHPNNVDLTAFMFHYGVPVFEDITGDRDIIKNIVKDVRKMQKKEHPEQLQPYSL